MTLDPAVLAPAIALAAIPSLVYLAVLNAVDRYEKEPWTILLACVGLGAVAAPVASLVLLAALGRPFGLAPQLAPGAGGAPAMVGIVQEVVKAACVLVLVRFARDEFDDVLDGVVYGAAVGAGFAAAETFAFAAGGTATLGPSTLGPLLVAGLDHAFYTATFGAVAGLAARRTPGEARVLLAYGLATAALLHALHDTLPAMLSRVLAQPDDVIGLATRVLAQLVNVAGLVLIVVVVWAALGRSARVLRRRLDDEVRAGVITQADLDTMVSSGGRVRAQLVAFRRHGVGGLMRLRRYYATAGELAFEREHFDRRRRRRPSEERLAALREELVRLRSTLGDPA